MQQCRLNEKVLFKFTNFCFTKHELSLGLNESLLRQKGSVILISGMIYFYSWGLLCTIHTCCIIVITFTCKQWLRQSKESSCTISKNKNHWITHLYKLMQHKNVCCKVWKVWPAGYFKNYICICTCSKIPIAAFRGSQLSGLPFKKG